jgi:phosphoglycolate phosphatase-like HAD superfamily hydrolase
MIRVVPAGQDSCIFSAADITCKGVADDHNLIRCITSDFVPYRIDAVWNEIGSYAPDEVVIVGDSLTSDIRGGKNAGILTCWYNPDHLPNKIEVTPDCTIDNLQDILSYLDESR